MTPSEKEKIIKEGFDAIRKVYNLRDDLLEDAGKLEAAKESNRKLSDRVANLEVTIRTLNSAIDKKDAEIKRLREKYDLLNRAHAKLCEKYNNLCEATAVTAVTEDKFHELRDKFAKLYVWYIHGLLEIKDVIAFTDWFKDTFGDFGIYDEEE